MPENDLKKKLKEVSQIKITEKTTIEDLINSLKNTGFNAKRLALACKIYEEMVNDEDCIGCGTCVEKCPMHTIDLEDGLAVVREENCIGCGVCAHHCPEGAIHLKKVGPRHVFIPPKKIEVG